MWGPLQFRTKTLQNPHECFSYVVDSTHTPLSIVAGVACLVIVHHKVSQLHISRTVCPRNPKILRDIQTDPINTSVGYDVTSCFRSAANWIRILAVSAKTCRWLVHNP